MPQFQPRDPAYADRVAAAFRDESAASRWGGELTSVSPGVVEIALPCRKDLAAAPGEIHRSFVAALLDDACVLAALSLTSPGDLVSPAEYKLNFLAPATGSPVTTARAEVLRPGRSITVCRADALADGQLTARMLATLCRIPTEIVPSPSGRGLG